MNGYEGQEGRGTNGTIVRPPAAAVQQVIVVGSPGPRTESILAALAVAGFSPSAVPELADICGEVGDGAPPVLLLSGRDNLADLYEIAAHGAGCPVVILDRFERGIDFLTTLQAGASGFCDPDASPEAIVRTVQDVLVHGIAIPRSQVTFLVDQLRHGRGRVVTTCQGTVELTEREWEVLSLMWLGRSTAEIAELLYVSKATVRSHIWALVHKLGVEDRDEMIALLDRQAAH